MIRFGLDLDVVKDATFGVGSTVDASAAEAVVIGAKASDVYGGRRSLLAAEAIGFGWAPDAKGETLETIFFQVDS